MLESSSGERERDGPCISSEEAIWADTFCHYQLWLTQVVLEIFKKNNKFRIKKGGEGRNSTVTVLWRRTAVAGHGRALSGEILVLFIWYVHRFSPVNLWHVVKLPCLPTKVQKQIKLSHFLVRNHPSRPKPQPLAHVPLRPVSSDVCRHTQYSLLQTSTQKPYSHIGMLCSSNKSLWLSQ